MQLRQAFKQYLFPEIDKRAFLTWLDLILHDTTFIGLTTTSGLKNKTRRKERT